VSDNRAFDRQFINYYFHRFLGHNPFGFSARRIGDLHAGLVRDASKASDWKKFRVTPHTHNPVDDAKGNAEALKKFKELGLNIYPTSLKRSVSLVSELDIQSSSRLRIRSSVFMSLNSLDSKISPQSLHSTNSASSSRLTI
jgi:hypothetical protein